MDKKLLTKLLGIVGLSCLLALPLYLIQDRIMARQHTFATVKSEIAHTAAGAQTLIGPVILLRYTVLTPNPLAPDDPDSDESTGTQAIPNNSVAGIPLSYPKRGESTATRKTLHRFIPLDQLEIKGDAQVETRYRGIYPARLYHLDLALSGKATLPRPESLIQTSDARIVDAHAELLFSLSDLRGIDNDPQVTINGQPHRFSVASDNDELLRQSFSGGRLTIDLGRLEAGQETPLDIAFPLRLTGTETFAISPTANQTQVSLASNWGNPSFHGRFLPDTRAITANHFSAVWEVSHIARNFDDALKANEHGEVLAVDFMDPVNIYVQSERAVKYGLLFIALTFAAFFLGETLRRHPLHFMHYLLVGLALTLFFLLLIAFSEHMPFLYAYLSASSACVGLITAYLSGALGWKLAFGFGAGFSGLYGVLYGVLKSEDNALLMGSLLLFLALAAIMLATRKLDWSKLGENLDKPLPHTRSAS